MRSRVLLALLALLFVVGACGTGDGSVTTDTTDGGAAPAATEAPTTQAPATTAGDESSAPATTTPASTDGTLAGPSGVDGPDAPDFSLALGDGTTYQLSADPKPVYMVFWAEW